ncbi:hypothetical protein [Streptomyces sp. NPDC047974]|uniref:hypothetical protein n=1 Tax=Streptomyces sp. NPDC047974 TaxID=3154343 RepID=UPI0033D3EA5C
MDWYLIPGASALLLAVSGVAALRTGFVLPWLRRRVRRVALHGWGQLVMGGSFALQSVSGFVGESAVGTAEGLVAAVSMVAALILLLVAQLGSGRD